MLTFHLHMLFRTYPRVLRGCHQNYGGSKSDIVMPSLAWQRMASIWNSPFFSLEFWGKLVQRSISKWEVKFDFLWSEVIPHNLVKSTGKNWRTWKRSSYRRLEEGFPQLPWISISIIPHYLHPENWWLGSRLGKKDQLEAWAHFP